MLFLIGMVLLVFGIYYNFQSGQMTEKFPIPKHKYQPGSIKNININVKSLDTAVHDYTFNDIRKYYLDMDGYYQLNAKYDRVSDLFCDMFNRSNISKTGLGLNEAPPEIFYL